MTASDRQLRVSVVMAAYNAQDTIGAAISGVLQQDHPFVELVVVDDGSTDRTKEICEAYGDLITFVSGPNRGAAAARNLGMRAASGEMIAFCDSDDQLLPAMISRSLRVLDDAPERSVVTNEALLSTATGIVPGRTLLRGKVPRPERQRLTMLQRNFVGIFSVFPRQLVDEIGGFDERLRQQEDWDFWLRAAHAGWNFFVQPSPMAIYRLSAGSLSTDSGRFDAGERLIADFVASVDRSTFTAEERLYLDKRLNTASPQRLAEQGAEALQNGDYRGARATQRTLLPLIVEDRRGWLHAAVIGYVPGAARALRARHRSRTAQLGRVGTPSPEPAHQAKAPSTTEQVGEP